MIDFLPYSRKEQEAVENNWSRTFKLPVEHRKTSVFDGLMENVDEKLVRTGDIILITY